MANFETRRDENTFFEDKDSGLQTDDPTCDDLIRDTNTYVFVYERNERRLETVQVYFVEAHRTTRSEGHPNGWAKGLPGPNMDTWAALGVCRFRDGVGNVAVRAPAACPQRSERYTTSALLQQTGRTRAPGSDNSLVLVRCGRCAAAAFSIVDSSVASLSRAALIGSRAASSNAPLEWSDWNRARSRAQLASPHHSATRADNDHSHRPDPRRHRCAARSRAYQRRRG